MAGKKRSRRHKVNEDDILYKPSSFRKKSKVTDILIPTRRSTRQRKTTFACRQLEKINSSRDSSVESLSPKPKIASSAASSAASVNTGTSRKRIYSLIIPSDSALNYDGDIRPQKHLIEIQQIQEKQEYVVHSKKDTQQEEETVLEQTSIILPSAKQKIPRPPNAFMLFANEFRRKLAVEYPRESNKDISVRLGALWKSMQKDEKDKYFELARQVDAEHKLKYPDYVYNPKEARMRKALREQSRESRNQLSRCHAGAGMLPGSGARQQLSHHQQWGSKAHLQSFPPGIASRQAHHSRQGLMSPRMFVEQQRSLEETKKAIREQVEQGMIQGYSETYLDIEAIPYHQLNHMSLPSSGDYAVIAELEGQQWMPYMQPPQAGAPYMMRAHEEAKLQQGGPWNQYPPEHRAQQVPPYPLRQQVINRSYGNCLPSQPIAETSSSSQQMGIMSQLASHNDRGGGGNDTTATNSVQQQQYLYQQQQQQQQQPATTSTLTQSIAPKEEIKREEPLQMLELISTSSASNAIPTAGVTTSTTMTQKSETTSGVLSADTNQQQKTVTSQNKNNKNPTAPSTQSAISEITSNLSDSSNTGTENTSGPLPAFEQAFGSTEIGRYSHEGFFNTTQQTESQQSSNNQNPDPNPIQSKSNQSKMVSNLQGRTSNPNELPSPRNSLVFSPTCKVQNENALSSSSPWSSLYFYPASGTNINPKILATAENISRQNPHTFNCYGSHFPTPSYAAFCDYALLSGADFMPACSDPDTILVGVPPNPGFGVGNELQLALENNRSPFLTSGNTFRDTEAGLDYVTLHIPANAITGDSDDPLRVNDDSDESFTLVSNTKEDEENKVTTDANCTPNKLRKIDNYGKTSNSTLEESHIEKMITEIESDKDVSCEENQKDDLGRQDLKIVGVPMRQPIVISETDRICVLMDPITDGKEFTSL